MENRKKIAWGNVFMGLFLIVSAIIIFSLYHSGDLTGRIPLPRFIWAIYAMVGVPVATLIQGIIGTLILVFGFKK